MKPLYKKLVLIWLVLWMPMAASIAATMPIYALDRVTQGAADESPTHHASKSIMPCHTADASAADDSPCSHCVLCHIANSIIPPSVAVFATTYSHDSPAEMGAVSFISFFPSQLQRPPSVSGI